MLGTKEIFSTVRSNTVHMLTERQQQLLDFLREEHSRSGIMPTTREIQEYFGFSSQTAAISHLRALERKGVIQRQAGKARALSFTDDLERGPVVDIPLYGSIAAGMAEEVEQEMDRCVTVDAESLGLPLNARTFALKVRGDSMVDAHILDGDCVILEFRQPRTRDIVAALIDGETTLKRYLVKNRRPYLKAENPRYPNLIPARELVIQGVMVGLLRNMAKVGR